MSQAETQSSALSPHHPSEGEGVQASLKALYNWNYEPEIDELRTLYANGLERQWIPTLRAIGLYSERIEAHIAEMFEANFRRADAGNLARSGQELPEDLDIWVNEGYENL